VFLSALSLPTSLRASPARRIARYADTSQRDDRAQGRFYDQKNRDWHDWNDNEERAYRQFLTENRREYREFTRLNDREQSDYWNWRHSHPDRDDRDAKGPGRYFDENARDWHQWNGNEDRAYRQYLTEARRDYRDFSQLDPRGQQEYWTWRHGHPDRDQDNRGYSGGGGKRYYDQNTGQWHDWDDNEDRAYRRFLDENHRAYIVFDQADLGLQLQFWLWRKFHADGGEQSRQRYFDRSHNEWHEWNEREEGAYRGFLVGNNRAYIEFSVAPPETQVQYWTWRRAHPDPDERGFKRYFDQGHNDWHVWDENEDRAYRTFMNGRHWPYREITVLLPRDQQRYWDWRHQHPDKDRDHR
jgi:hypothetical protein